VKQRARCSVHDRQIEEGDASQTYLPSLNICRYRVPRGDHPRALECCKAILTRGACRQACELPKEPRDLAVLVQRGSVRAGSATAQGGQREPIQDHARRSHRARRFPRHVEASQGAHGAPAPSRQRATCRRCPDADEDGLTSIHKRRRCRRRRRESALRRVQDRPGRRSRPRAGRPRAGS
jgi:hypothetical protein